MNQTLGDQRIVVTSPSETLLERLRSLGADAIHLPVIRLANPKSWEGPDRAIDLLAEGSYDWVVFSSTTGVDSFLFRANERGAKLKDLFARVNVAAVGRSTAESLWASGIDVDVVPTHFTAIAAAETIGSGTGRVLLPRPEVGTPGLVEVLREAGWVTDEVVTYRTVAARPPQEALARVRAQDFDIVTFKSGSAVRFFTELLGDPGPLGLGPEGPRKVVVIGPSTATTARERGLHVDAIADPHTDDGVVDALVSLVGR